MFLRLFLNFIHFYPFLKFLFVFTFVFEFYTFLFVFKNFICFIIFFINLFYITFVFEFYRFLSVFKNFLFLRLFLNFINFYPFLKILCVILWPRHIYCVSNLNFFDTFFTLPVIIIITTNIYYSKRISLYLF